MLVSSERSLKQIAFSQSISLLPVHLRRNEEWVCWRGRSACSVRCPCFPAPAAEEQGAGVFQAAFPVGSVEPGSLRLQQQTQGGGARC